MVEVLKDKKLEKAVLITGGFHTGGVENYLRENRISYLTVSPSMRQLESNENYLKQMLPKIPQRNAATVQHVVPDRIPLPEIARIDSGLARFHRLKLEQALKPYQNKEYGPAWSLHRLSKDFTPSIAGRSELRAPHQTSSPVAKRGEREGAIPRSEVRAIRIEAKKVIRSEKDAQGIETIYGPKSFLKLSDTSFLLANWGNHTLRRFELEQGKWIAREGIESEKDAQGIETIYDPISFLKLSDTSFLLANASNHTLRRFELEQGKWIAREGIESEKDAQGIETIYFPISFLKLSDTSFLLANLYNDNLRRFELEQGKWIAREVIKSEKDAQGIATISTPASFLKLSDTSFLLANTGNPTLRRFEVSGVTLPEEDESGFHRFRRVSVRSRIERLNRVTAESIALVKRLKQAEQKEWQPILSELERWPQEDKQVLEKQILTAPNTYFQLELEDPIVKAIQEAVRSEMRQNKVEAGRTKADRMLKFADKPWTVDYKLLTESKSPFRSEVRTETLETNVRNYYEAKLRILEAYEKQDQ
jgi:hypothetical protein